MFQWSGLSICCWQCAHVLFTWYSAGIAISLIRHRLHNAWAVRLLWWIGVYPWVLTAWAGQRTTVRKLHRRQEVRDVTGKTADGEANCTAKPAFISLLINLLWSLTEKLLVSGVIKCRNSSSPNFCRIFPIRVDLHMSKRRAKNYTSINSINLPHVLIQKGPHLPCPALPRVLCPINLPLSISLPLQCHSTLLLSRETKRSTDTSINSDAWHVAT